MAAELMLDTELADFAYSMSRGLLSGSEAQLLLEVMYHACFGRAADAIVAAGQLVSLCTDSVPASFVNLLNAGYALYRVGALPDAAQVLTRAYDEAHARGMHTFEARACLLLARMHWSVGDLERSRQWRDKYASILHSRSVRGVIGEFELLSCRLAIEAGALEEARSFFSMMRKHRPSRLDLPRMYVLATELSLRMAEGARDISASDLQLLLGLHFRARSIGLHDDTMGALHDALVLNGRSAQATLLLQEYLTRHRRDGFPPLACLVRKPGGGHIDALTREAPSERAARAIPT